MRTLITALWPSSFLLLLLAAALFITTDASFLSTFYHQTAQQSLDKTLIAHAGGGINNQVYTNSLEALNKNYTDGHRLFEIDFSWTSDNKLVAIHDWQEQALKSFGSPGQLTYQQFKTTPTADGLTRLTLADINNWLINHPQAVVVTDIKSDNLTGLRLIASTYPQIISQ